jgi:hypothetical protein
VLAAAPGVAEVMGPETFADLGLPASASDTTQGDLVLHAAEGWYFTSHATPERAAAASSYRGTHGHRTDDPRLHAAAKAAQFAIGRVNGSVLVERGLERSEAKPPIRGGESETFCGRSGKFAMLAE